ncbi:MAG: four helix bundle protein [Bacteroidetes bacterium]|nr:MAG: four helix bundle protein [Bacteroidota bacterium]
MKERTEEYGLRIIRMFAALPKTTEAQVIGKQVLRSGTSVGANYREANRGRSKAEFVAKLGDCLKELDETDYWLSLLVKSEIVPVSRMQSLIDPLFRKGFAEKRIFRGLRSLGQ